MTDSQVRRSSLKPKDTLEWATVLFDEMGLIYARRFGEIQLSVVSSRFSAPLPTD
jgi:hypothetical protein